ncbi:hypothetical protein FRC17_004997 [Serendipita sp. 399]|nr:hypothetical protein FRC17_004997 [Serendipita sp. 399]
MDFNPRPILHSPLEIEENDESGGAEGEEAGWWKRFRKRAKTIVRNSSSTKSNSSPFSKLPFRAYQRPVEKRYISLLLTLDHIIGTLDDEGTYEVLQFYEDPRG